MESLQSMRALLAANRPRSWNLGYPSEVRSRIAAYVTARRAAGALPGAIAGELGISRQSAVAWPKAAAALPVLEMVPVVVLPDAPTQEQAAPPPPSPPPAEADGPPACMPVLLSPRGFRVEGLSLAALGTLLERLG